MSKDAQIESLRAMLDATREALDACSAEPPPFHSEYDLPARIRHMSRKLREAQRKLQAEEGS